MSENRDEKPNFPEEESTEQKELDRRARQQRVVYVVIMFSVAAIVFFATVSSSPTDTEFDISDTFSLLLDGSLKLLAVFGGFYVSILLYFSIHETGHIVLGALNGLRVRIIQIRRFTFLYYKEKWRLRLISFKELPLLQGIFLGSGSFYTTSNPENLPRRMAIMASGGPIASAVLMFVTIGLAWAYQQYLGPHALIGPMIFTFLFIPFWSS